MSRLGIVALESKLHYLSSQGFLDSYRFLLARTPMMLGQTSKGRSTKTFLEDFKFSSLESAGSHSGMGGILCAAFSEDIGMLRLLANSRADVNSGVSGLGNLGFMDGQSALLLATRHLCSVEAERQKQLENGFPESALSSE